MQSSPVRLPLPPGTTAHQLMAQGMPESSAYRILKQGWYCPGYNQRCYPQYDGPGGFAHLETPERFVRAYVLRTLEQWDIAPRRDLVEDLTQDGLLACWQRRHAPHIQNFPRYYAAMLRGLITQHCKRLQREQQRSDPGRRPAMLSITRYRNSATGPSGKAASCWRHRLQKRRCSP